MKSNLHYLQDKVQNTYNSLKSSYVIPVLAAGIILTSCDENKYNKETYTDSTVPQTEINVDNTGQGTVNVNTGISINSGYGNNTNQDKNQKINERVQKKLDSILEVKLDSIANTLLPKN